MNGYLLAPRSQVKRGSEEQRQLHAAERIRRSRSAAKDRQGLDVLGGPVGKVIQNFGDRHPTRQVIEHVGNGNPGATHAGFAAANLRMDGDALPINPCPTIANFRLGICEIKKRVVILSEARREASFSGRGWPERCGKTPAMLAFAQDDGA